MAVFPLDRPIPAMDHELGSLVLANLTPRIDRFGFRVEMPTGPLRASSLHVPPAGRVWNDVVTVCY